MPSVDDRWFMGALRHSLRVCWRECKGVEPSFRQEAAGTTDLKSEEPTGTHPLPRRVCVSFVAGALVQETDGRFSKRRRSNYQNRWGVGWFCWSNPVVPAHMLHRGNERSSDFQEFQSVVRQLSAQRGLQAPGKFVHLSRSQPVPRVVIRRRHLTFDNLFG